MNNTHSNAKDGAWASEFGPACCGRVIAFDPEGRPLMEFPGNTGDPVVARCLDSVFLDQRHLLANATVLLVFEHGDPLLPIIVGVLESASPPSGKRRYSSVQPNSSRHALVDGRRVTIRGNDEVTLVCGKASITLTKDGRIEVNGTEIISRASGANKIRGASVNIN